MIEYNRFIKRADVMYAPPSHIFDSNGLKDWALYTRVDDSVFRINYVDMSSGHMGYDLVTTTSIEPDGKHIELKLGNIFNQDLVKDGPYKTIPWNN